MSLVVAQTGVGTDWSRQGGGWVCISVCVCTSVCVTMISKSTHQNGPLPSFMFLSLVLWSGNHLDGRKIGHCKLKLDKLFIFALVTQVTMLSMTVYAVLGKPDTSCFQCVNLLIDFSGDL